MIIPPTPQEQIEFLSKLQRLLSEGLFVASYMFALLRALADLSVQCGDDTGSELELPVSGIAEQFIALYWRQVRPFAMRPVPGTPILRQNSGVQAKVVRILAGVQDRYDGSLGEFQRTDKEWRRYRSLIASEVAKMPLWKLQRVGRRVDDFLYPQTESNSRIVLRPGIAFCFRKFYSLIRNVVEGAWAAYVRRLNQDALGEATDLQEFLFGSERTVLEAFRPILLDLQKGRCFYCKEPLVRQGHVDHFVPWSRYPVDLGHNFVLADAQCNRQKTDLLAAEDHLVHWVERNRVYNSDLSRFFRTASLPSDLNLTRAVTRWAYSQTAEANGMVWMRGKTLVPLGRTWATLLQTGPPQST